MPLIIADRVLESSTTTGTGVFTLAGASLGFRAFASVCAVADTVWYYIEGVNSFGVPTGEYEYGLGTYSAANQLTRTTVRGSSNGGSPVNFTAGTKLVGIAPQAPDSSAAKGEWRAAIGAAASGVNSDITSLAGLTTPLSVAQGGTGLAAAGTTFSAYLAASGGSVANVTFTKALFDTEIWDANGEFGASRFTATVAGYYQINAAMQLSAPAAGFLSIFKNGSEYKRGSWPAATGGAQDFTVSGQVKLAASDYVEIYIFQSSGGSLTPQGVSTVTWFDGHFVRGL